MENGCEEVPDRELRPKDILKTEAGISTLKRERREVGRRGWERWEGEGVGGMVRMEALPATEGSR